MVKGGKKLLVSAFSACMVMSSVLGDFSAVQASAIEGDNAVAGIAVTLNRYYENNKNPEADILNYLLPLVASTKESETEAAQARSVSADIISDNSGVFGKSIIDETESASEKGVVTSSGRLNVRNKPSLEGNIVGYIYSNCKVDIYRTVKTDNGTWYLIKSSGVEGYVSSEFVKTGAEAVNSEPNPYAQPVAVTEDMVKSVLEAYINEVNYSRKVYEEYKAAGNYQAAYNAITYAYDQWGFYINDASNAGYTDLVETAKVKRAEVYTLVQEALAKLNADAQSSSAETKPSSSEETKPSSSEEIQPSSSEETLPSSSEDMPSSSSEEIQPSSSEDMPSSSSEETLPSSSEDMPSSSSEETLPSSSEDMPSSSSEEILPSSSEEVPSSSESETVKKEIAGIEAFFSGSGIKAGEAISADQIYVAVTYADGTVENVADGWMCDMIGVPLSEGEQLITVYYGGFASVIPLVAGPSDAPGVPETQPTEPETQPTEPETQPTEPETQPTEPETQPTPPETQPTEPETQPTPPETQPTEPETQPTPPETQPTVPETQPTPSETQPTVPETPPVISTPQRDGLVAYAVQFAGNCNYVYGGTNLTFGGSVDCSGFTMRVYQTIGYGLPHSSAAQRTYGAAIDYNSLRPGDLVFYSNPGHVAIYIGDGQIVHAKNPQEGVVIDSIFFKVPDMYRTLLP